MVDTQYELNVKSGIVLPKGSAVALLVETATANLTGFITLVEES